MSSIEPNPSINIFTNIDNTTIKERYPHLVITTKPLSTRPLDTKSMSINDYYLSPDLDNKIYIASTDTATGISSLHPTLRLTTYFDLREKRSWTICRPNKSTPLYFSLLASKVRLKMHELSDNTKLSVLNSFSMKSQDDYRLKLVPDPKSESELPFKLIVEEPHPSTLSQLR